MRYARMLVTADARIDLRRVVALLALRDEKAGTGRRTTADAIRPVGA